ncbi:MAG TPA: ribbon-helix-helix protein, CopG family [Myxococcota bacterium]|nr:ribbon-helix-helix protein, CopG family [Myxococcota bacterium]
MAGRRKATGRGGWRPGAGRRPELKRPARFTLDLEGPQMDALEKIAEERGVSVASVVREAVAAYLARRDRRK